MYESAYDLMAVVSVVKVLVDDANVPGVIEESNTAKNGWDRDVTSKEPCAVQTSRASYSCSATAKVARYHG